nr:thiamine pyrophosphate-dependent enzyme [Candidatus Nanopelagicales bacterium]
EARTYRFRAHSMFDPERYRDKAEVALWRERDPIELMLARLRADGSLDEAALEAMEHEIADEIQDAVDFAEASADEDVADLMKFVYSPTSTVVGRSS